MMKSQSRPGTTVLAVLTIAASVGLVGCSSHPAPSVSNVSGQASSSASAQPLVDVEKVWASHPLPDCPKPPLKRNDGQVPAGLELPTESTVSDILGDVKSPAPEAWVRAKLGWVTQELLATRADIVDADTPGDSSMLNGFKQYVRHVRDELLAGQAISASIDKTYPEGCS